MKVKFLIAPPMPEVAVPWRDIHFAGRFAQRDVTGASAFISSARERGLNLGIEQGSLERLDLVGAFQPIFFSQGGYFGGARYEPEQVGRLTFREEQPAREWESYAWESHGYPEITVLYSPWQLLYVEDALDGATADFELRTLLEADPARGKLIDSLRVLLEGQQDAWQGIDEAWRPLMKLLVRLQNHYWPKVSGRVGLLSDAHGNYIPAGPESGDEDIVDAHALIAQLGLTRDEVLGTYTFLVERGLDRDPQDGLTMLRRARPRPFHTRWRDTVRRAQDHFDAAEMLRRLLIDLDSADPPPPEGEVMDGRQLERASLYASGPAGRVDEERLKELLIDAQLYPHGILAIGEGVSERIAVEGIIGSLLGGRALRGVQFYDLGGSGGAVRLERLLDTFGGATLANFVVVDREGRMGEYVESAIRRGIIARDDVQLCRDSLEADNATTQELIDLVADLGRNPPQREGRPPREPAELALGVERVETFHASRVERSHRNNRPGLADSLLNLARRPEHGSVSVEKPELAEALTAKIVAELRACSREQLPALKARRPIARFILERMTRHLDPPQPRS